ncbi:MAG: ATPase domain-containing protein [Candidatus Dormibacteraceae bacterium]
MLFVGEYTTDELESAPEFSLADGILELAFESREPVDRRWLRVRKLRGTRHLAGHHALRIDDTGITLFVRAETIDGEAVEAAEPEGRISIGVPGLDRMTHGGLPRGGSTIVLGPSGCGKTALALSFIVKGLENGESCLYVTFTS